MTSQKNADHQIKLEKSPVKIQPLHSIMHCMLIKNPEMIPGMLHAKIHIMHTDMHILLIKNHEKIREMPHAKILDMHIFMREI